MTLVIVAVVGLLTWRAYRNGFVRELVGLAALILAVPVAGIFYDDMIPKVEPLVDNRIGAALLSFLAILIGVVVGGQILAYLLKRSVNALNLGGADHLAGGAFGLLQGVLICQVLLVALVIFPKPDFRTDIDDSLLATTLLDGTPFVLSILPERFGDAVDLFLDGLDGLDALEGVSARLLSRAR